jgi:hypothetical protein
LRSSAAHRRGLVAALLAAALLVLLRSYIFLRYAPAFFDSDQAVVGLMAKHLSEGRGLPLFFYGQSYMLGVESWIAVPFFWIGGPTVAMLKLPLLLINIGVAAGLIVLFVRRGLGPGASFIAVLPFVTTTPVFSSELMTALGASVEPFLYLLILWGLRRRPLAFGVVFCLATLHREFALFAWPAVVVACALEGRPWSWRQWLTAGAAAAVLWGGVDLLKTRISIFGPGGGLGPGESSSLVDEARVVGAWLSLDGAGYLARLHGLVVKLPELLGGRGYALQPWGMDDTLTAGSAVAGVAIAVALVLAVVRLARMLMRRSLRSAPGAEARRALAWPLYLLTVAVLTVAVYGLNTGIDAAGLPVTRYVLFGLLAPTALFGAWLLLESDRRWRAAGIALVSVWAAFTAADNARWALKLRRDPPGSEFRYLADDLVAHGVRYARGQYWDAYVVTFFARERVEVASTDKVRIEAYQHDVDAHGSEAATLTRVPCETGRHVASWCVAGPGPHVP